MLATAKLPDPPHHRIVAQDAVLALHGPGTIPARFDFPNRLQFKGLTIANYFHGTQNFSFQSTNLFQDGTDIVLGMVAEGWAQTTGRLVEFTDETSSSTDGGYSWVAHVRYAYTVEGHAYEGTTIHPTYGSPPSNRMDRRLVSLQ